MLLCHPSIYIYHDTTDYQTATFLETLSTFLEHHVNRSKINFHQKHHTSFIEEKLKVNNSLDKINQFFLDGKFTILTIALIKLQANSKTLRFFWRQNLPPCEKKMIKQKLQKLINLWHNLATIINWEVKNGPVGRNALTMCTIHKRFLFFLSF